MIAFLLKTNYNIRKIDRDGSIKCVEGGRGVPRDLGILIKCDEHRSFFRSL